MRKIVWLVALGLCSTAGTAWGASQHVTFRQVNSGGVGDIIGAIVFEDSDKGLRIMPNLKGLSEGQHGIHVHQNPSCDAKEKNGKIVPGLGAGGHFDPKNTTKHEGPVGQGHLGDLPVLYVDAAGRASRVMWAEHLKVADLAGRAIVIHGGGDNYSDSPSKLGGGGARVACGVVVN